jgi:hypothetical protein
VALAFDLVDMLSFPRLRESESEAGRMVMSEDGAVPVGISAAEGFRLDWLLEVI